MGFPTPKVFVTADSVGKGKPDPEGKCALDAFLFAYFSPWIDCLITDL
jgi:hypothetical protein